MFPTSDNVNTAKQNYKLHQPGIDDPLPAFTVNEWIDNEIHPLWQWKNWRYFPMPEMGPDGIRPRNEEYDQPDYNYDQEVYDRMAPALRLATVFLHEARDVLVRIARGAVCEGKIDPDWRPLDSDYSFLDYVLNHLAVDTRVFYINRIAADNPNARNLLGASIQTFDVDYMYHPTRNHAPSMMALAAEFIEEIYNGNWWSKKSSEQQACVLFMIALVLVHEVAHCIYIRRQTWGVGKVDSLADAVSFNSNFQYVEPNIPPLPFDELGFAAVIQIHGHNYSFPNALLQYWFEFQQGIIPVIPRPMYTGSLGICLTRVNPSIRPVGAEPVNYTLLPQTIMSFFDKNTWNNRPITYWLSQT